MIGNRSLIQKADLALSDLTTSGGILQPAQAQRFIRTLIDESVVMPLATVVPMRAPTQLIEKLRFGSRVLRAGTEGQALGANDRAKPDLEKIELSAQLFKGEVHLNNEILEDSIERAALRQTIIATMAERVALDMDEIIVNGDTSLADPFLKKFDGILKLASINVLSNSSNPTTKTLFKRMLKTMPSEFLRNKKRMRFLTSVDAELDYRDSLSNRETAKGDSHLAEDTIVGYGGVPVIDVPVFPEDLGGGTNETKTVLTDPKNINVGIWRQIKIETDKDISAGVLLIVVSLRFDTKFAEPKATVRADDVLVG